MAVFVTGFSVTSRAAAWYEFKRAALETTSQVADVVNWRVRTSSTGSVYAQQGDVIASSASLGALSWFVLQGKGRSDAGVVVRRELCFQLDGAGLCRIKYSPRGGFVGGSPSTTRVPSATDEQLVWGGGTDASPTFAVLLPVSGVWMIARFSEAEDAFFLLCYPVGGGLPTAALLLETVPTLYSLGGAFVDSDPAVVYAGTGAACATRQDLGSEVRGPLGYLALDSVSSGLWARLPASFRAVVASDEALAATIPGGQNMPPSTQYGADTYAQEAPRFGRRVAAAGTLLSGEAGNANTTGDKGEATSLRWSGRRFAVAELVDSVQPSSGYMVAGKVLGLGDLFWPWEIATAPPA